MVFRKKSSMGAPEVTETHYAARAPEKERSPWMRLLLIGCGLLILGAGGYEASARIQQYGARKVVEEAEKMNMYADLKNKPAWLHESITNRIIKVTEDFASGDAEVYKRLANPLDQEILREVANNYIKVDARGNRAALGENGWIKKITKVQREVNRATKRQTIEIYAEYRKPAAWVLVGAKCYMVDAELVRLPDEYSPGDRKVTKGLMTITGLENTKVPEPSVSWSGDDLAAGMKLVDLIQNEKWAAQVDSIDVSNYKGRRDERAPWVVLNTIWPKADGTPRVVWWGRTLGDEKYYEVSAKAKLEAIQRTFVTWSRIDAGRDYVDVHGDLPKVPLPPSGDGVAGASPRG